MWSAYNLLWTGWYPENEWHHTLYVQSLAKHRCTHTHTHPFNGPLSVTTQVSRYQKGKTNLVFTEARDSEWQWHQLGHMQVCTLLQTDNHASTPPLSFLQAGCPSCHPTNSVRALKEIKIKIKHRCTYTKYHLCQLSHLLMQLYRVCKKIPVYFEVLYFSPCLE